MHIGQHFTTVMNLVYSYWKMSNLYTVFRIYDITGVKDTSGTGKHFFIPSQSNTNPAIALLHYLTVVGHEVMSKWLGRGTRQYVDKKITYILSLQLRVDIIFFLYVNTLVKWYRHSFSRLSENLQPIPKIAYIKWDVVYYTPYKKQCVSSTKMFRRFLSRPTRTTCPVLLI